MIAVFRLLALLGTASLPLSAAEPARPNILFLIADDLGCGELPAAVSSSGASAARDIPTPHLDALAASGVRFTNGYVTAPFCAASRAALMTGRWQTRFGFEFNPIGARNAAPGIGLPVGEKTIADRLRDAGYATSLVGKWHLGGTAEFHPMRRGFDEFFGFLHEGHTYVPSPWTGVTTWLRRRALPDGGKGRWTSPDGRLVWSTHLNNHEPDYDADNPILRSSQPVDERANLTDAFTREACDFIARHRAQPFFLTVAYSAVHSPMQGADAYMAKFAHIPDVHRRIFAALLAHLDDSVGRILAQLRTHGLVEKTLVVFLSDNGGPTRELTSSNAPLRGEKGSLYEGGVRVPFLVSWPGVLPAGRIVAAPIVSIDWTVTAQHAARTAPQANADGVNLLPFLRGETTTAPRENVYWRVGKRNALRSGDWKLIRDHDAPWQLYDLAADLGEKSDLAAREPDRVAALAAIWEKWNAANVAPKW
jgi:arylsulfatase B